MRAPSDARVLYFILESNLLKYSWNLLLSFGSVTACNRAYIEEPALQILLYDSGVQLRATETTQLLIRMVDDPWARGVKGGITY